VVKLLEKNVFSTATETRNFFDCLAAMSGTEHQEVATNQLIFHGNFSAFIEFRFRGKLLLWQELTYGETLAFGSRAININKDFPRAH
jgi:hypothetical protein